MMIFFMGPQCERNDNIPLGKRSEEFKEGTRDPGSSSAAIDPPWSILDSVPFLFFLEVGLQKKWGERDEGADKNQGGTFNGPFALLHGEVKENEEKGEDDTMDHAGNAHGGLIAKNAFFINRIVEKNDEREPVEQRAEAQEAEWKLEHDLGRAFLSEHKFISFGVETECEMDESVLLFRFANHASTVRFDELDAGQDIVTLET